MFSVYRAWRYPNSQYICIICFMWGAMLADLNLKRQPFVNQSPSQTGICRSSTPFSRLSQITLDECFEVSAEFFRRSSSLSRGTLCAAMDTGYWGPYP